jgi:hypothetical protein
LGFAALLTAAFADELPLTTHRLLSDDDIARILANGKGLQGSATPLCAFSTSTNCRVFALPSKIITPQPFQLPVTPNPPLTSPAPAAATPTPTPLNVSCPKEGETGFCHLVNSLTDVSPGGAGATLYLGGSQAAYLSKRAASGLLTSEEIRGLINEKTIGILPEAVETSAADGAISVLARSAIAKTSRGAAAVGVVLMTYAAYRYFYPEQEKPADAASDQKK